MNVRIDPGDEPDEHRRYADYCRDLAHVSAAEEVALVSAVLRDPDRTMAEAAIAGHLDRRAAQLLGDEGFAPWATGIAAVIAGRQFVVRRLDEWRLLRSITVDEPWTNEEVRAASDWFQRKAAEVTTAPAVLTLLENEGRTRRVRAAAGRRIARLDR